MNKKTNISAMVFGDNCVTIKYTQLVAENSRANFEVEIRRKDYDEFLHVGKVIDYLENKD